MESFEKLDIIVRSVFDFALTNIRCYIEWWHCHHRNMTIRSISVKSIAIQLKLFIL